MRFSVGYKLTEAVRSAILRIREDAWGCALEKGGSERANRQVVEITASVDLSSWPSGSTSASKRRSGIGCTCAEADLHAGRRFQRNAVDARNW
jgi:hypothetical protein